VRTWRNRAEGVLKLSACRSSPMPALRPTPRNAVVFTSTTRGPAGAALYRSKSSGAVRVVCSSDATTSRGMGAVRAPVDYKSRYAVQLSQVVCKLDAKCIIGMVALRRRSRGPPPRRPVRSSMDLGQAPDNTTPSRFPADRRNDQNMVGSHLAPTFFSLRLRVAQHFTYRLAAET
jgi:hypothetical protein